MSKSAGNQKSSTGNIPASQIEILAKSNKILRNALELIANSTGNSPYGEYVRGIAKTAIDRSNHG